jgi:type I restriction enzyme M protein
VAEQDYSLNPGRYVGVVIEEDGKTEAEFLEEVLGISAELSQLQKSASQIEAVVAKNLQQLVGEP